MDKNKALEEVKKIQDAKFAAIKRVSSKYDDMLTNLRNMYSADINFLRNPNYRQESSRIFDERELEIKRLEDRYDEFLTQYVSVFERDPLFIQETTKEYFQDVAKLLSAQAKSDPIVMMSMVKTVGCGALKYADESVKNNRAYILACEQMGLNPETEKFFPFTINILTNRPAKIRPTALEFASEEIRSDYEFCLQLLKINPSAFGKVQKGLNEYDVFMAKAVIANAEILRQMTVEEVKTTMSVLAQNGLLTEEIQNVYNNIQQQKTPNKPIAPTVVRSAQQPVKPSQPKRPPDNRIVRDPYGGKHTVDQVRNNQAIPGRDQTR